MDHQSSQVCTFPKPCCSDRKTTTYFACIFFRATRLVTLYFAPKHSMLVKSTITYETECFSLPCFASGWMIFTKKIMFGRKGRKWNRPSDLMFFFDVRYIGAMVGLFLVTTRLSAAGPWEMVRVNCWNGDIYWNLQRLVLWKRDEMSFRLLQ